MDGLSGFETAFAIVGWLVMTWMMQEQEYDLWPKVGITLVMLLVGAGMLLPE